MRSMKCLLLLSKAENTIKKLKFAGKKNGYRVVTNWNNHQCNYLIRKCLKGEYRVHDGHHRQNVLL